MKEMKEKIVSITAYKDGGTKRIILNTGIEYYVNNRLLSTTKGEVFPAYPSPKLGLLPVSDREKTILIQCLEEYGRESGDYGIGTTIHDISMTIQNKGVSGSMGYTIIDIHITAPLTLNTFFNILINEFIYLNNFLYNISLFTLNQIQLHIIK